MNTNVERMLNLPSSMVAMSVVLVLSMDDPVTGRLPQRVESINAISYHAKRLAIEWPCEQLVNYTLLWNVEETKRNDSPQLALREWSVRHVTCQSNMASCKWPSAEDSFPLWAFLYDIYITSSNEFGSVTSQLFRFDGRKQVKPDAVHNLSFEYDATSINLTWGWPMPIKTWPFVCRVLAVSQWNGEDVIIRNTSTTEVSLGELNAFTQYIVSVSCKPSNSGYWSDNSSTIVTTSQLAPSVAPIVPTGWFRVHFCNSSVNTCSVTIFLQSVPLHLRHGIIVKYLVTIQELSETVEIDAGSELHSIQVQLPRYKSHLSLRAATVSGPSPPSEDFMVTVPQADHPFLNCVSMETTEDGLGVTIEWVFDASFDNFTVLYCSGRRDKCLDEPKLKVVAGNETSASISPVSDTWVFAISANSPDGSTGLSPGWLCKYLYHALPAKAELQHSLEMSDDSVTLRWRPLGCSHDNRARVMGYSLRVYEDGSEIAVFTNVTSVATSHLVINNLLSDTAYNVTLQAMSRVGLGPADYRAFRTNKKPWTKGKISLSIGLLVFAIGLVIGLLIWRKCRKCMEREKISPPDVNLEMRDVRSLNHSASRSTIESFEERYELLNRADVQNFTTSDQLDLNANKPLHIDTGEEPFDTQCVPNESCQSLSPLTENVCQLELGALNDDKFARSDQGSNLVGWLTGSYDSQLPNDTANCVGNTLECDSDYAKAMTCYRTGRKNLDVDLNSEQSVLLLPSTDSKTLMNINGRCDTDDADDYAQVKYSECSISDELLRSSPKSIRSAFELMDGCSIKSPNCQLGQLNNDFRCCDPVDTSCDDADSSDYAQVKYSECGISDELLRSSPKSIRSAFELMDGCSIKSSNCQLGQLNNDFRCCDPVDTSCDDADNSDYAQVKYSECGISDELLRSSPKSIRSAFKLMEDGR